jgi:hypothetical protein
LAEPILYNVRGGGFAKEEGALLHYGKRQNETANLDQFRHLPAGDDTDAQSLRLMGL